MNKLFLKLKEYIKKKYNYEIGNEEEKLLGCVFNQLNNQNIKNEELEKKSFSKTLKIIIEKLNLQKINEENIQKQKLTKILCIDSRDRNYTIFPNSNEYTINIEPIFNILSIELLSLEIPKNNFNINESNNKLFFQETSEQVLKKEWNICSLLCGYYEIKDLKKEIEYQMNNKSIIGSKYTFDIETLKIQKKVIISSNKGPFNLIFYNGKDTHDIMTYDKYIENSIGSIIGFPMYNYTKSNSYIAPNSYNLDNEQYLFLNLNNYDGINFKNKNYFAKCNYNKFYSYLKNFNSPLKKLDKLEIKFFYYNEKLYNFNNLENSMTLKIDYF